MECTLNCAPLVRGYPLIQLRGHSNFDQNTVALKRNKCKTMPTDRKEIQAKNRANKKKKQKSSFPQENIQTVLLLHIPDHSTRRHSSPNKKSNILHYPSVIIQRAWRAYKVASSSLYAPLLILFHSLLPFFFNSFIAVFLYKFMNPTNF